MHWYYLAVGLLVGSFSGYALQDLHWQSFFSRLLHQADVFRIDISVSGVGDYEVALHHGKKKRLVNRVICKTVREGLIKHLHEDRSNL
jgi:hypothetical protein